MKKKTIINMLITFGLCFITHNIYQWFPNNITSIFFPVNESIWEHMKMLFSTFLLTGFIDYLFIDKRNILISSCLSGIGSIILYLILFLPFNSENLVLIFSILIIDIIIFEIIRSIIINNKKFSNYNKLAYVFIIIVYIIFGYLTYNPIHIDLFKDSITNQYGINTYII